MTQINITKYFRDLWNKPFINNSDKYQDLHDLFLRFSDYIFSVMFTNLFNNHSGKISKYLIKIWDGLNNLSNLSLSLFYHHRVLLNQHQLIVCKTLREKTHSSDAKSIFTKTYTINNITNNIFNTTFTLYMYHQYLLFFILKKTLDTICNILKTC